MNPVELTKRLISIPSPSLGESDLGGEYMRLYPHLHGTDGFFAAVLERE